MWRYLTTSVTLIIILVLTTHAKTKLFGNMNYPYSKIDTVSATSVFDCLRDASWSDTVGIHNCVILGPLQFSNKDDLNSGIDTIRCFWWCERSRFRGKIKLYRTYFNAIDFFDVSFDSVVDFHHTIFQDSSNFNRSIFNKEVNFNFSTFNNKASFGGSEFVDKADFSNSCFRDTILSVNFSCRFNKEANFSYTSYAGQSEFRNSEFYKRTDFGWSRFFADCNFLGSHFYDVADFENSQFLKGSTLILANSIIDRQFILTKPDTTWFTGPSNPAKPWNGPFLFCDSSSLLITDASFSPGNIVLTWDGFKNSSGYRLNYRKGSTLEERHRDYTIMMENFKARGDWPSYDLCFLEWKKLELEIESFSLKYLLNRFNYRICASGIEPFLILGWSIWIVIFFGLQFALIREKENYSFKCLLIISILYITTGIIFLLYSTRYSIIYLLLCSIYYILGPLPKIRKGKKRARLNDILQSTLFSVSSYMPISNVISKYPHREDQFVKILVISEGFIGYLIWALFIITYVNILFR